ncbi:hypothetical protein KI387_019724, partial [Taxus chinensis]
RMSDDSSMTGMETDICKVVDIDATEKGVSVPSRWAQRKPMVTIHVQRMLKRRRGSLEGFVFEG